MQVLGISLILIGGLSLAIVGFGGVDHPTPGGEAFTDRNPVIPFDVLISGIAVTAGLIFLTVGEKRESDPSDNPSARQPERGLSR